MVFFNYSTMQMAAKVVYYGPGLCGKTTNLQWIFDHTSNDSRGEMVSLATETDRQIRDGGRTHNLASLVDHLDNRRELR